MVHRYLFDYISTDILNLLRNMNMHCNNSFVRCFCNK